MPHAALRLVSGVDQNRTPTFNEAGVSSCQLIRYKWDDKALLIEKLGGWDRFYPTTMTAIVRALWAWEDTIGNAHLAIGLENNGAYQTQLSVITDGSQKIITPTETTDNIAPAASTTSGSSIVTITDATTQGITQYDAVYIPVQISIGGLVLFGLYPCNPDGHGASTTFTVQAVDTLGSPLAASGSSTSPTVPSLATTLNSASVIVTLANHGYNPGDDFPVLILTVVGGISFYGHYQVQSVTDANTFVIIGGSSATASTSGSINGGNAQYVFSFGVGASVTGSGYGIGGYGLGGYGSGTSITPAMGTAISANDWTIDNWGEILVACPNVPPVVLTTTALVGNGTTGSVVLSELVQVLVGDTITISGVQPATWNGVHVVTVSNPGNVSFLTTAVGPQTTAGVVTVNSAPFNPIYYWAPQAGQPTAQVLPFSPPVNDGMFVAMPQRQIIAWGSTFNGISDPLLLRWCDVNNYNVWIATKINQAGSFRIPRGSRIVGAIQGPQQGLVWTDVGVWSMQYISQPYVYSFNELGYGCGLIGRKAAGVLNGVVYWMGPSQFYNLTGDGVEPLMCPIWDVIFQDLDTDNLQKIRVAVNSRFGEVTWYYPNTSGGGEVNAYVKYNIMGQWDYGLLGRSAWVDQSVLGPPIGADPATQYLYQHETSPDADGQPILANFTTGYSALQEADMKAFVDQIWFDAKWGYYGGAQNATINLTFYATDYPGQSPRVYGPYAITQSTNFVTPRIRARLLAFSMSSSDIGSFWRIGLMRYRYQPDGKY